MATLKIPDGVTYRKMWVVLSPFGYVLWDVMSDYKDYARKSTSRVRGRPWEDLEAEGWSLVKAWIIWKPEKERSRR